MVGANKLMIIPFSVWNLGILLRPVKLGLGVKK